MLQISGQGYSIEILDFHMIFPSNVMAFIEFCLVILSINSFLFDFPENVPHHNILYNSIKNQVFMKVCKSNSVKMRIQNYTYYIRKI